MAGPAPGHCCRLHLASAHLSAGPPFHVRSWHSFASWWFYHALEHYPPPIYVLFSGVRRQNVCAVWTCPCHSNHQVCAEQSLEYGNEYAMMVLRGT